MNYGATVDVLVNSGGKKGPFGNVAERWTVSRWRVPCDVQRANGREVRTDAGEAVIADYCILADINPPWSGASRLRWNGHDLSVIDVDQDTAQRGHHSETLVRKVSGGSG